jgi:hypothetical protein
MKRLLLALFIVWVVITAATASTVAAANAITTFLILIAWPLVAKYVKLDGPQMAAVVYVGSFVIALAAALISGELALGSLSGGDAAHVWLFATTLYGVQQVVFGLVKDNPVVGKLVK